MCNVHVHRTLFGLTEYAGLSSLPSFRQGGCVLQSCPISGDLTPVCSAFATAGVFAGGRVARPPSRVPEHRRTASGHRVRPRVHPRPAWACYTCRSHQHPCRRCCAPALRRCDPKAIPPPLGHDRHASVLHRFGTPMRRRHLCLHDLRSLQHRSRHHHHVYHHIHHPARIRQQTQFPVPHKQHAQGGASCRSAPAGGHSRAGQ